MYKKRTYKKRTDPYLPSLCVKENLTFVPPSISSIYCFTNSFYLVTGLPMKRTVLPKQLITRKLLELVHNLCCKSTMLILIKSKTYEFYSPLIHRAGMVGNSFF